MSDLKAPTYELMTESLSALVQLFNVHQAQSQTNINLDRDKVGAEPGDLASEASYEPWQRPPCLRRCMKKQRPGFRKSSPRTCIKPQPLAQQCHRPLG